MADIHPFRGIRYNQGLVKDLSSAICPPYDIIGPAMAEELRYQSEYNFIRLELWIPQETDGDDKYTRSAATLEQWLKQGVLKMDEVPAIYLHDCYFTYNGKEYRRRGMIACIRLEEWEKMVVRPHEDTLGAPKADRLKLLWALQANTSPVFVMYEDRGQQISSLLALEEQKQPIISLSSATEGRHNIWAITEPEVVGKICANLAPKPLYIADGHHRYTSALNYRRERTSGSSSVSGEEEFNFVMTTLVDFSDPGLLLLATHRLVRGIPEATLNELRTNLGPLFEIEEVLLDTSGVWQQADELLNRGSAEQVRFVLVGLSSESLIVLKPRDFSVVSQMMPASQSELTKGLDVSILDNIILEELLGLTDERQKTALAFNHDLQDSVNRVLNGEYQLAFLLRPIKAGTIKAVADTGDRMPRKSTYFYPKMPSGLLIHRLV